MVHGHVSHSFTGESTNYVWAVRFWTFLAKVSSCYEKKNSKHPPHSDKQNVFHFDKMLLAMNHELRYGYTMWRTLCNATHVSIFPAGKSVIMLLYMA